MNSPTSHSVSAMDPALADQYLKHAIHAAQAAGAVQMRAFGQTHTIHTKGSTIDLVTAVDRECDALIRETLQKGCPGDLFLTEETFEENQAIDLSHTWVIDPVDGTTNYAHSFPHFATSIAYFLDGQPYLGVVYDPFKKELFYALRDRGAFLNDAPIFVSNNRTHKLSHALLATGFPYDIGTSSVTNLQNFERVAPHCRGIRRPGAAALDLTYLAAGRLDAFWELKLSVWDVGAGCLIVEEAGGKITDLRGEPLDYAQRRIDLIGSNGTGVHTELQALLALDI